MGHGFQKFENHWSTLYGNYACNMDNVLGYNRDYLNLVRRPITPFSSSVSGNINIKDVFVLPGFSKFLPAQSYLYPLIPKAVLLIL